MLTHRITVRRSYVMDWRDGNNVSFCEKWVDMCMRCYKVEYSLLRGNHVMIEKEGLRET